MPDLTLVRDVYAGSRIVKEKSAEYLPQETKESNTAYKIRVARSVWWAGYRKTVRALVGMVFRKAPTVEKPATQLEALLDDIDLQGNALNVFVKNCFRQAFDGHMFILVDMPRPLDPAVATQADEYGRRPYWCPRTKDQIINWVEGTNAKGEIVLTQVTIKECVKEQEGRFGEAEVEQWRVLYLVSGVLHWELWRKRQNEGGAEELYIEELGILPKIDFIPLVKVPTNSTGFMTSDPPLVDLAYMNVGHFQISSDHRHILHVANVPILVFEGREDDNADVEIGPNAGIDIPIGGKVYYVEHAGQAIGAARQELQDTERRMGVVGLEILAPRTDAEQTATASLLDDSNQTSELGGMVEALEDAINMAFWMTARFLGMDDAAASQAGEFECNKDFQRFNLDPQMLQALSNIVLAGQLPVEELLYAMNRAEMLSPGFDVEKAKALIGEQALAIAPKPVVTDPALAA